MKRTAAVALAALLAASGAWGQKAKRDDPTDPTDKLLPDHKLRLGAIQTKIDDAITRGCDWLIVTQNRDGSWTDHATSQDRNHHLGITALATYTLLKSGYTTDHPAVKRALVYMTGVAPTATPGAGGGARTVEQRASGPRAPMEIFHTYDAGCMLMALMATHDRAYIPVMQEILNALVSWQVKDTKIFTYGKGGGGDLSNTQYAALGLRAADLAGLKVPPDVYSKLLEGVLKYQEKIEWKDRPKELMANPGGGKGGVHSSVIKLQPKKMPVGGFFYSTGTDDFASARVGSMTTAGIAIVAICRLGLEDAGKIKEKERTDALTAEEAGVHWLTENYDGAAKARALLYYMYGLERVGSILDIEYLGDHPWYVEGAEYLTGRQGAPGNWDGESDTCFAILFLKRATRAIRTGGKGMELGKAGGGPASISSDKGEVAFKGTGSSPMKVWILGFHDAVKSTYGAGEAVKGLRVASVEYLVDGEVAATVRGNPKEPWKAEKYEADLFFKGRGLHKVGVRVNLVDPKEPRNETKPTIVASAEEAQVTIRDIFEPWMLRAAEQRRLNLLLTTKDDKGVRVKFDVKASTEFTPRQEGNFGTSAPLAFDGYQGTYWACKADDKAPMIQLTVKGKEAINAHAIALSQLNRQLWTSQAVWHDRIKKVAISVNGAAPFQVDLDPDDLRTTYVPLPKPMQVNTLAIAIVEREPGKGAGKGQAGFTEIGLEALPVK